MKAKITIPFGINLANDGNSVKFLENGEFDCIMIVELRHLMKYLQLLR
jgi:hypothetical protein